MNEGRKYFFVLKFRKITRYKRILKNFAFTEIQQKDIEITMKNEKGSQLLVLAISRKNGR